MSRFANPNATIEVDVGPCQCPNTPHDRDRITARTELGYGAQTAIGDAIVRSDGVMVWGEGKLKLLELAVVSWNLLDHEGKDVPVSVAAIRLLDEATVDTVATAIDDAVEKAKLPNGSGAPSVGSSPGSASSAPTADQTPSSPTTS